jgi:YD repeat-containing protein
MRRVAFMLILVALTGCAGSSGSPVPAPQPTAGTAQHTAQVELVITIPKTSAAPAHVHPHYISPSTQSMAIGVMQGGVPVINETTNLTPTSSGCSSTLASTVCTLTLALDPGNYIATLTTYDQPLGAGNVLSEGQNIAFTVLAGVNNQIALTLSGVPASYVVTPQNLVTTGSDAHGFTIAGTQAQTFTVSALDVDGNYIVGVGAPTYTIAQSSGSGWTIANPSAAQPNNFTITPATTQNSSATLQVTANFSDSTCSLPSAVCTAAFTVKNDLPTLFVAACATSGCGGGSDAVLVYQPPYTGTPTTITSSIDGPAQLALDGSQNLYVANVYASSVGAYAPPYTSVPYATLSTGGLGVQVTPGGAVVVTRFISGAGVFEYPSIFSSTSIATLSSFTLNFAQPAIDASGNIWLMPSANELAAFAPPTFNQIDDTSVPPSIVQAFAVSPSEEVYVAGSTLVAVGPAGGALQSYVLPSGTAYGVTYDPSGDAVAATTSGVVILNSSASLLTTITNGVSITAGPGGLPCPQCVAVDNGYDIFVANNNAQTVTIYKPPYSSVAVSIPTGYTPEAVLLGP